MCRKARYPIWGVRANPLLSCKTPYMEVSKGSNLEVGFWKIETRTAIEEEKVESESKRRSMDRREIDSSIVDVR